MLIRHGSRITGAEVSYLRKFGGKTRRGGIGNSQIRGKLNQELVTKMVNKKKLRWFGHLIGMDSNRKPSQVWETELSKRGEKEDHRMG
jgi:hypothetical protein